MEGLILPGEIEINNEKFQVYLEYNLNEIKKIFPDDISKKYQRFFKYIANKEKEDIDYKMLSNKFDDINFHYRYNTFI